MYYDQNELDKKAYELIGSDGKDIIFYDVARKDIHELLENNAVRKYIESTIELLEKR